MIDYMLLKSISDQKNKRLVRQLDESFFIEKSASLALSFYKKHVTDHDDVPNWETVISECNLDHSLVDLNINEKADFYFKKVDNRKMSFLIKEKLNPIAQIVSSNPYEALKQYREKIKELSREQSSTKGRLLDWTEPQEIKKRIDDLNEREKNQGMLLGIPTPWDSINKVTNGIQEGQFWVFVAKLKTGKSWTIGPALVMDMVRDGYKVLVITPELVIDSYAKRFDSTVSKVPYQSFIRGDLTTDQKNKYVSTMLSLDTTMNGKLWLAGDGIVEKVSHIEELHDRLDPDIIVLDGLYLISPNQYAKDKHDSVVKVVKEIKDFISKTKVRFVASHQFNRKAEEAEELGGSSFHVGSAYEIPQYVDVLLGLYRPKLLVANRKMVIKMLESRDSTTTNVVTHFDLDNMDFSEVCSFEGDKLEDIEPDELIVRPQIEQDIQQDFSILTKDEIFTEEITSFNIEEE